MINFEIEVEPSFCNDWPKLIVEYNNDIIFDDICFKKKNYKFKLKKNNKLKNFLAIGMNNKRFGKNHVWDTKIENNIITADKTIKIIVCKLDDICVKDLLFKNFFQIKRVDKQPSYFPDKIYSQGIMNYNGYFFLNFDLPLYNCLITQKHKQKVNQQKSYFSNYTKVFHYDEEITLINEIEDKLKSLNEKSNN